MRLYRNCSVIAASILAASVLSARPQLLIRCDDIGMCHSVNLAAAKVLDSGLPISASVMFACPWYQEAVEILKQHTNVAVGVHLTLNAEWKNFRWGPAAGAQAVPSLVDSNGFFFPSRAQLFAHKPTVEDVERELRAQINRAMHSGIGIDYLDYHMSAAVSTAEFRAVVERLAAEYKLGISRYFGEIDLVGDSSAAYSGLYTAPPDRKTEAAVALVSGLKPGTIRLLVCHIGLDTPEMQAMIDMNPSGPPDMSKHRQGEMNALLAPEFRAALKAGNIRLVTYRDLVHATGLDKMTRPSNLN
jgi:chitin disaccharide deacetylase